MSDKELFEKKSSRKLSHGVIPLMNQTEFISALAERDGERRTKIITELVDKFLGWELPKSVCSDQCVAMRDYKFPRSGTNLLDINEAKQMIEYLLSDFLE